MILETLQSVAFLVSTAQKLVKKNRYSTFSAIMTLLTSIISTVLTKYFIVGETIRTL